MRVALYVHDMGLIVVVSGRALTRRDRLTRAARRIVVAVVIVVVVITGIGGGEAGAFRPLMIAGRLRRSRAHRGARAAAAALSRCRSRQQKRESAAHKERRCEPGTARL